MSLINLKADRIKSVVMDDEEQFTYTSSEQVSYCREKKLAVYFECLPDAINLPVII